MYQPIQLKLTACAGKDHSSLRRWRYFLAGLVATSFAISTQGSPIDGTLYTSYSISTDHTSVNWFVCGSTQESSGCFDAGNIGPFGKVGALLESEPSIDTATQTVTRKIYVVDVASGGTGVDLDVYTKKDVISLNYVKTTVVLSNTISLPLTGGSTALTSMAANNQFLFVGTNKTAYAVVVAKKGFAITETPGFSPPINVAAITADAYGYVTVTSGSFSTGDNGFYIFPPDSNSYIQDGGGARFMLGTTQAVLPSTFK